MRPAGTAAVTALIAAAAGATVQLVGKVGDDEAGDAVVLALAAGGVGHVALLREAARVTPTVLEPAASADDIEDADQSGERAIEPADRDARPALDAGDVELGLRYLTDFRGVVVAEPLDDAVIRVVADAAAYAGAELVVVIDRATPSWLPPTALVLEPPADDPEGAFAAMLGRLAAAIDAGRPANAALDEAAASLGAVRTD